MASRGRPPKYAKGLAVPAGFSLPQSLLIAVDSSAAQQGVNRSTYISQVLATHLNQPLNYNQTKP